MPKAPAAVRSGPASGKVRPLGRVPPAVAAATGVTPATAGAGRRTPASRGAAGERPAWRDACPCPAADGAGRSPGHDDERSGRPKRSVGLLAKASASARVDGCLRPHQADPLLASGTLVFVAVVVPGFLVLPGVIGVPIHQLLVRIRVVTVVSGIAAANPQFLTKTITISAHAVVLQAPGNLHLLGLGSAAPHWLDPLMRGRSGRPLVANASRTDAT